MTLRRADGALSDVTGTMLMLGATVTIISLVALALSPAVEVEPLLPLDVRARGSPGGTTLALEHLGGNVFDKSTLRVVVSAAGATLYDAPLGSAGSLWSPGDVATLTLYAPLAAGQTVDVNVVSTAVSSTLASEALLVGGALVTPPPTTFTVLAAVNPTTLDTPAPILVTAIVSHSSGRQHVAQVTADLVSMGADPALVLRDDGTRGDLVASDGIYSAVTIAPPNATLGAHVVRVRATDVDGVTADSTTVATVLTNGGSSPPPPPGGGGGSDDTLKFNSSRIAKVSARVLKFMKPGNGRMDSQDDLVTVHFKVDLVQDPVLIGTNLYYLSRVHFDYNTFDAGKPTLQLDESAIHVDDKWFRCENLVHNIKLFSKSNATLDKFNVIRNTLVYYYVLEWRKVGGGANDVFREYVESEADDNNMILTRNQNAEVLTNGWSTNHANCNP